MKKKISSSFLLRLVISKGEKENSVVCFTQRAIFDQVPFP